MKYGNQPECFARNNALFYCKETDEGFYLEVGFQAGLLEDNAPVTFYDVPYMLSFRVVVEGNWKEFRLPLMGDAEYQNLTLDALWHSLDTLRDFLSIWMDAEPHSLQFKIEGMPPVLTYGTEGFEIAMFSLDCMHE